MMDFIMRCLQKSNLSRWFYTLGLIAVLMGMTGLTPSVNASGIDIVKASIQVNDESYVLDAQFNIQLTPQLSDVLHKGVALYFVYEFELVYPRWYWLNKTVVAVEQHQRLIFNTLTRQYRVSIGALYQNFTSLPEALAFMSHFHRREEGESINVHKATPYKAALQLRLDETQLPKPFQLNTGNDWNISSGWYRWAVNP